MWEDLLRKTQLYHKISCSMARDVFIHAHTQCRCDLLLLVLLLLHIAVVVTTITTANTWTVTIQVCCYHHCCCVWPMDCLSITGNTCACCILSFWPLGLVTSHVAATATNIGETKIYRPERGSMPRLSSSARVHAAEGEGRILPFDFLHFHLFLTLVFFTCQGVFLILRCSAF